MSPTAPVFVDHPVHVLGERCATLAESEAAGRLVSRAEDLAAAGFGRHHLSSPGSTAYDLARRCAERLGHALHDVDAIVYSTCLPANANVGDAARYAATGDVKHVMDFPASRLQSDFGLDDAFVVGLNQQACTGMLGGLRLARALITSEPEVDRVLCLTADRFPEGARYEQAYNLISDGAAACIVSVQPGRFRLLASAHVTNGALAVISDDEVVGSYFNATLAVVDAALARAGLDRTAVTWVVPQNTNVHAWRIMARLLGLDEGQVVAPTLAEVGHMISGDNIANLAHLVAAGALRPGDVVVLVMAGYGMNWQCTVLEAT